jgi:hypothetical protein
MPPNHQAVLETRKFDGERYREWAKKIGDNTYFIIDHFLTIGKVEEQGYKSCMGVLQLSKTYSAERLEAACKRAKSIGSCTYSTVKTLLKNGVENAPENIPEPTPEHENIRGSEYYQ